MFLRKLNNAGISTVEACVIIPISFSISMLLVWLGIFFYNKNLLSESASRAVIYGTEYSEYSNDEIKSKVEEKLLECISEGEILLKDVEYTTVVDFNTITVSAKGNIDVPRFIILGDIYIEKVWEIEVTKRSPRLHNSAFIRTVGLIQKGTNVN